MLPLLCLAALGLPGCGGPQEVVSDTPAVTPGATYTGPIELRGTIGSLCRLAGREPLLVSGYGVTVNLDGTGSPIVPEFLDTWLANEMRRQGVGSAALAARNPEWGRMTPQRLLRDPRTAVVRVSGLIPPGATAGSRFDLLVEAMPEDTGTTSLAGGQLWRTSLGVLGDNRSLAFVTPLAAGSGPVYITPYQGADDREQVTQYMRRAVIVGGGVATQPRVLELILNQASYARAGLIANTINERFPPAPGERLPTANARTDQAIEINLPERYRNNPQALLDLIAHTFPAPMPIEPTVDDMVSVMADAQDPELRRRAGLVCKALGPNAVPALRAYYDHPTLDVRLTVLEVGAFLRDDNTSEHLLTLAGHPEPGVRRQIAQALVHLPRSTRGLTALRRLLDDSARDVRLAAYESLAVHGDQLINRLGISDLDGLKFVVDRVETTQQRPLLFITAEGTPRIVLFDPQMGFRAPVFASLWNGRMLIRTPTSIDQALFELEVGNDAFLPIVRRGEPHEQDGYTVVTAYDALDNQVLLRTSTPQRAQRLIEALPTEPQGDEVFTVASRLAELRDDGTAILDYLAAQPGLGLMPLSVYYRSPFEPGPRVHRLRPTVATLAFFLGHYPTMDRPEEGLDLNFGQVVDALYQLADAGAIDAELELRLSPLSEMIASVQTDLPTIERRETSGDAPGRPEPTPQGEPSAEEAAADQPAAPEPAPGAPATDPEETAPERAETAPEPQAPPAE